MPKVRGICNEQSNIMLTALIIFLGLSVLGTAVLVVSSMEMKMSNYAYEAEQAQQAADAGVDWTLEKIYGELQNYLDEEELPGSLSLANPELNLGTVNIDNVTRLKQTSNTQGDNYCIYSFNCTGIYEGAAKIIKTAVKYNFTGGYMDGELLISRSYLNRGRIISYTVEN